MTLVIAAVTPDGIAVAADSRTTTEAHGQQRVLSDSTCKLFEIAGCAVGTAGWAFLSQRNIASHVSDLIAAVPSGPQSSATVANEISTHFGPLVQAQIAAPGGAVPGGDVLHFLICGFDVTVGQVLQLGLPSGTITTVASTRGTPGPGWTCIGQTDVVARLFIGYDQALLPQRAQQKNLAAHVAALQPALDDLSYVVGWDGMNLQDGVDFADLAIRTTVEVQRLTLGTAAGARPPGVGGMAQIAVVTPDSFEWLARHRLTIA